MKKTKEKENLNKSTSDEMLAIRHLLNERKTEELKAGDIVLCCPSDYSLPLSVCEFGIISHVINNYAYCKWENKALRNSFHTTIGTPVKREFVLKTNLKLENIEKENDLHTLKYKMSIFNKHE